VQLTKPLKPSTKFVATGTAARSSGLTVGKKASATQTASGPSLAQKGDAIKVPLASADKDETGYASTRVVNMLDSSTFEGELTPLKRRRKRVPKLPHLMQVCCLQRWWRLPS
jgi:hypothetical protein